MCDYDRAFDYFNKVLTIEISTHGSEHGHANISKLLGHIAHVHQVRSDKHLALDHVFRALKMEQEILPLQHH